MIPKSARPRVASLFFADGRFTRVKVSSALRHSVVVSIVVLVAGCVMPPTQPQAPTPTVAISAKVPVIVALAETSEAQEKGGVEIAVVPVAYQAIKKETTTLKQVPASIGETFGAALATAGHAQNVVVVERTTESHLVVNPPRLAFTVRINNKLNRVFRGQGSVVQINVDGNMLSFDRVDYRQFINGIVPPLNEASVSISADALSQLPEKGTIGIFLYDVVTATDVAGNTTEKQNYKWYFSYTTKAVEERAEKSVVRQQMSVAVYQQEMAREQQEKMTNARQGP